jgi:hypothetical protein
VIGFGGVLAVLALTGLVLVLVQVFVVHALCTLCLCSAAISWINAALGRDEVGASLGVETEEGLEVLSGEKGSERWNPYPARATA